MRLFCIAGVALLAAALPLAAYAQDATESVIAQGRSLVQAGDCAACHTDNGGKPFAGGLAISTPFGVIYSSNITPDKITGLGMWTEENFYHAMHDGIRRDGKHLYPAFPYPWFTKISRDDVHAIKAYLDTLKPVYQENKPTLLPWPLSMRGMVAAWNALYLHKGVYQSDTAKSAQWNRGAYLVEGLGHCGACHTPSSMLGGPKASRNLHGSNYGDNWFAPGLTSNLKSGLGDWNTADIITFLKTGANARSAAAGPMAEVVKNSTQYMSDDDLNAIATYLKDIPAEAQEEHYRDNGKNFDDTTSYPRGEQLYADNCTGCHMENGAGIAQVFPALKGSSAVQARQAETVTHLILAGAKMPATKGKPTAFAMPAFNWKLDDAEVADLANYIRNAWGNHAPETSARDVSKVRKTVEHGGG